MLSDRLLQELIEWLRIPSISSGGGDPADLVRAAEWAAERVAEAGGSVSVVTGGRSPLLVGELRSDRRDAPTVLIYGHYDVQSADPLDLWAHPPFDPVIVDGRLYARGASDDKGNFYPLLYVACELARAGALPVNVRVLIEGEEEAAGDSAVEWIAADETGADCAIVFDGDMLDTATPALTLGVRGIVMVGIDVRTAPGDLHSGMYGGSVLNAAHVLNAMLAEVMPDEEGMLRPELREGITPPTVGELKAWSELPPGNDAIAQVGGRPLTADSGATYYEHNWANASVDVHGIDSGDAHQIRTIIPCRARAKVSIRLAPGQSTSIIGPRFTELMRAAVPPGAEVDVAVLSTGEPALFDPQLPPLKLAAAALESACGRAPALTRVGGSLPVLAAFAEKGIPVILSGFALPEDAVHAPDESFRLESLRLGELSARALYEKLAELPPNRRA